MLKYPLTKYKFGEYYEKKKKKLLSLLVVFFSPTKGTQNQQQWNSGNILEPDKTILLNTESRLKTSYPATKDFIISSKSSTVNFFKSHKTRTDWKIMERGRKWRRLREGETEYYWLQIWSRYPKAALGQAIQATKHMKYSFTSVIWRADNRRKTSDKGKLQNIGTGKNLRPQTLHSAGELIESGRWYSESMTHYIHTKAKWDLGDSCSFFTNHTLSRIWYKCC